MYNPYNFQQFQNNQYNPYMPQIPQPQMQNNQLIRVNGIEGAKAYQMSANSVTALFDANDDYFYLKQTDGAGFGSIRTFKFEELNNLCENVKNNANTEQFVTRKDMEEYVKQFISTAGAADKNQQAAN